MSLTGALQIGRSGLLANQTAIEVTGNNLANIATRGYHRQSVVVTPANSQEIMRDIFVGRGVQVQTIIRRISESLEGRIRTSISNESASLVRQDVLSQIEALQNELSDVDLSTRLGEFFNALSELANNPQDRSLRSLVVSQATRVTSFLQELRSGLSDLRSQTDTAIDIAATAADDLLSRIEDLNQKIVASEGGQGVGAAGLRDQRDLLLQELSQYIGITTNELPNGAVDVFVGSIPIILNGQSRGLEVRKQSIDGDLQIDVVLKADGSVLDSSTGQIGALVTARRQDITGAIDALDDFTGALIYEFNKVHASGQGLNGFNTVTGTYHVVDSTAVLNSANAGLPFAAGHGSFKVHITDTTTGIRTTTTVNVDLDGLGGNDTTLASLTADLNAIGNLSATILPDGRLRITTAGSNLEVSFSADTSGALAALGINTFFNGSSALDVEVNQTLVGDLNLLAATTDHNPSGNGNALALAALRDTGLSALGGASLMDKWQEHVEDYAVRLSQVNGRVEADAVVKESLLAQQQAVSGVNADEEAINLLTYQRAYQGSARFLQVVDSLIETLLGLV